MASASLFEGAGFVRTFADSNFECRLARDGRPVTGSEDSDHWVWVRHIGAAIEGTNRGGVDGVADDVALLCLADMPPPAVMTMQTEAAPISSATWMMNFLEPDEGRRADNDGWWLLRSRAEQ